MVNDGNSIKIYDSKNSEEKKENKKLFMLKRINGILTFIFLALWMIAAIISIRRGYENYYMYTVILILIPFLFTVISNFDISKKIENINKETIRIVGKVLIIVVLMGQLI